VVAKSSSPLSTRSSNSPTAPLATQRVTHVRPPLVEYSNFFEFFGQMRISSFPRLIIVGIIVNFCFAYSLWFSATPCFMFIWLQKYKGGYAKVQQRWRKILFIWRIASVFGFTLAQLPVCPYLWYSGTLQHQPTLLPIVRTGLFHHLQRLR